MKLSHQTTPPAADANDVSNRDDPARNLRESGGTTLSMGAVADGEYLKRSGTSVISAAVSGTDANAIHKNVAAEISTVTEKASPVSADLLLIEDSADSNNKKRVQLGNLPFTATGFGSADFLFVILSGPQDNPGAGPTRVQFDTILTSKTGGDLDLDSVTNVGRISGLKAGRTYMLMAALQVEDDTPNACYGQGAWYNVTGAAIIGMSSVAYSNGYSSPNSRTNAFPAFHVFTPSVDTEVEFRCWTDPTTTDIWDGTWAAVFELAGPQVGATDETFINTIRAGDVASHDSATPLVVSQFAFDPSEYGLTGATRSLVFRAVAANGGGVAQTKARLYSVTDTEYIGSGLTFTTAAPAKQQETLTIGSGAGEVDDSEKIYEVHIWVVSPDEVDDTIELGSAELRLINTVN